MTADLEKQSSYSHGQVPRRRMSIRDTVNAVAEQISFRERIRHFTFAWYTLTMSTGGIALLLALTPHRFRGLDVIGTIVFIFDLLSFALITLALVLRFLSFPKTLAKSLTHPSESLFISTFFLSIAAALSNVEHYGVPHCGTWLVDALRVCFWIYLGATFAFSVGMYHVLFLGKRHLSLTEMTPAWILPIFPVMLAGTLAGFMAPSQPAAEALPMLAAGLAAQGLGFLVSVFMFSAYLSRLMAYGLPVQRPGMFIAVGPPSFTAAAFVAIGSDFTRVLEATATSAVSEGSFFADLGDPVTVAGAIRLASLSAAVFLWALACWFFTSAVLATVSMPDKAFHLSWWSLVFPNVGFTIACIRIGEAFGSEGVLWLGTVLTCALVFVWAFVAFCCVRAVVRKKIMFPGRDEDTP